MVKRSTQAGRLDFVFFLGGLQAEPVERLVGRAQAAITLDTVELVANSGYADRIVVVTDSDELGTAALELGALVEVDEEAFHFGGRLRECVIQHGMERVFYLGGGSTALLEANDLADICDGLLGDDSIQIPNNFWSSDFVAFHPGSALDTIELPASDNNLAYLLERQAGLRTIPMVQSAATSFDIDTPGDLQVLNFCGAKGRRTQAYLQTLSLDMSKLTAAASHLTKNGSEVIIAGRVSTKVLQYVESHTACRSRVFSEERGMRASGRSDRNEVRSLLGKHYQAVGPKAFFSDLSQLGQAAFIDSRVLFSHLGLLPSTADRFYSDLLEPEWIVDPVVEEFTWAAREASIPIVLGGHSIVAGALWALVEAVCPGLPKQSSAVVAAPLPRQ